MEEIRLYGEIERTKPYQQAVDKVREILTKLAPELLQDLAQPVRGALSSIETKQEIEQHERSAQEDVGARFRIIEKVDRAARP